MSGICSLNPVGLPVQQFVNSADVDPDALNALANVHRIYGCVSLLRLLSSEMVWYCANNDSSTNMLARSAPCVPNIKESQCRSMFYLAGSNINSDSAAAQVTVMGCLADDSGSYCWFNSTRYACTPNEASAQDTTSNTKAIVATSNGQSTSTTQSSSTLVVLVACLAALFVVVGALAILVVRMRRRSAKKAKTQANSAKRAKSLMVLAPRRMPNGSMSTSKASSSGNVHSRMPAKHASMTSLPSTSNWPVTAGSPASQKPKRLPSTRTNNNARELGRLERDLGDGGKRFSSSALQLGKRTSSKTDFASNSVVASDEVLGSTQNIELAEHLKSGMSPAQSCDSLKAYKNSSRTGLEVQDLGIATLDNNNSSNENLKVEQVYGIEAPRVLDLPEFSPITPLDGVEELERHEDVEPTWLDIGDIIAMGQTAVVVAAPITPPANTINFYGLDFNGQIPLRSSPNEVEDLFPYYDNPDDYKLDNLLQSYEDLHEKMLTLVEKSFSVVRTTADAGMVRARVFSIVTHGHTLPEDISVAWTATQSAFLSLVMKTLLADLFVSLTAPQRVDNYVLLVKRHVAQLRHSTREDASAHLLFRALDNMLSSPIMSSYVLAHMRPTLALAESTIIALFRTHGLVAPSTQALNELMIVLLTWILRLKSAYPGIGLHVPYKSTILASETMVTIPGCEIGGADRVAFNSWFGLWDSDNGAALTPAHVWLK